MLTGREVRDRSEHAEVADGEGSALVFFWLELAISSALGQFFRAVGNGCQASCADIKDDRCDESGWSGYRHGNVSMVESAEVRSVSLIRPNWSK